MQSITINANAKINLSLNITGTENNLHTLDMVLVSVDLCDTITVTKRADNIVSVKYSIPDIVVGNDSVTKAAELFVSKYVTAYSIGGLDIFVKKRIPLAAGLGGSGVDAAGVLNALAKMYGITDDLSSLATVVGSDAPYLLHGGLARVTGTGNIIEWYNINRGRQNTNTLHVVLTKPPTGVLSSTAYKVFDTLYQNKHFSPSNNNALIDALLQNNLTAGLTHMDNALTTASIHLNPAIYTTLTALQSTNALKAIMTGSGSCCVGFFENAQAAQSAATKLQDQNLWAVATTTVRKT